MTTYARREAQPAPGGTDGRAGPRRRPGPGFLLLALLASLVLGVVSLFVLPRGIGYDPWSWIIWGRELVNGRFSTAGAATSFKPLPVIFTAAFGWAGSVAPLAWLAVARAGAAFAVIVAFRVGTRLAGPLAGGLAALGLLASSQYMNYLATAGMAEPIGAGLCLAAVDAHLSRRRWGALLLLAGAGLVRIELWAFVAVYGLGWVVPWRRGDAGPGGAGGDAGPEAAGRGRGRRILAGLAGLAAVLVALPAAWFLPDYLTTGSLVRSAVQAAHQSQGGPLLAAVPALATVREASNLMAAPFVVAFFVEVGFGVVELVRVRKFRTTLVLALAALGLVAIEAVMAQLDLDTGASRYLLQAVAVGAVVAGCGCIHTGELIARTLSRARGRRPDGLRPAPKHRLGTAAGTAPGPGWGKRVAAGAVAVVLVGTSVPSLIRAGSNAGGGVEADRYLAGMADAMPKAIRLGGGRAHILACGPVYTVALQVPTVTWAMRLPLGRVGIRPQGTGTVFSLGNQRPPLPASARYTLAGRTALTLPRWKVLTTCPPGGSQGGRRG